MMDDIVWFDYKELMKQDIPNNTLIRCVNKLEFTEFITTMLEIKCVTVEQTLEELSRYQFSIIEKEEKR